MSRSSVLLLAYYVLMASLVFFNTRVEARFGVSRATKAVEALLACAIFAPLILPLVMDIVMACLWR